MSHALIGPYINAQVIRLDFKLGILILDNLYLKVPERCDLWLTSCRARCVRSLPLHYAAG